MDNTMNKVKTITDLLLSGPTDENAARENDTAELLEEVERLRERVQVLEVIVQDLIDLIVNALD